MSIKIYNGYMFDKNYSFLELNALLGPLKKEIQAKAQELYSKKIIEKFLYIYDCYTYWGEETALARMKEFTDKPELDWHKILFQIEHFVYKEVKTACTKSERDFQYDLDCSLQILPIKDKILFLYYGEKKEYLDILESQSYVEEYHYQNQVDMPENISESDWKQRYKDWDAGMPDWIPANNGFTVKLVNVFLLDFLFSNTEVNVEMPSIEERAKKLAYDIGYTGKKITLSFLASEEYKTFLKDKTKEIIKKLRPIKDINNILDNKE